MDAEKQSNAWGQIVVKAGADEKFKKRLLANPSAVLKENGLEVPTGIQVKIVEDSDKGWCEWPLLAQRASIHRKMLA